MTADSAWVHAYLHRVEGDLGNAGYWYRQAGQPVATGSLEAEWERIAAALLGRRQNMSATRSKLIKGATGDWEMVDRTGGPCPGHLALEAVLRRLDRIRRRAEQPRLAGRRGDARHAARHQRGMRPAGGAHRPRPQRQDQSALGVRPQELFLSGSAAGLPDQPVQVADRRRGRGRRRTRRRRERHRRHRAAASGTGRRQVAARPEPEPCRSWTSTAPVWR